MFHTKRDKVQICAWKKRRTRGTGRPTIAPGRIFERDPLYDGPVFVDNHMAACLRTARPRGGNIGCSPIGPGGAMEYNPFRQPRRKRAKGQILVPAVQGLFYPSIRINCDWHTLPSITAGPS